MSPRSSPSRALLALVATTTLLLGSTVALVVAKATSSSQERSDLAALREMSKQDAISPLLTAVIKAAEPAVVTVRVKQEVSSAPMPQPEMDSFLRRFFGEGRPAPQMHRMPRMPGMRGMGGGPGLMGPQPEGTGGSGVVVDADKGYVLTNWHVVKDARQVEVVLHDGRTFNAEWVHSDSESDLAVIKIKPDNLTALPLGNSDGMERGELVVAVGAPNGLPQIASAGIIAARGRALGPESYGDFIQTDAAINRGNSGGPLLNTRGEVIGINDAIVPDSGAAEGIGLAIPSNVAHHIMGQLVRHGQVVRGYLGVAIQDVSPSLAKSFNLPTAKGALVSSVADDSPAAKAGLRPGDFLVALAGKPVTDVTSLRNRVADTGPGTEVTLDLYRNGEKKQLKVTVGQQPAGAGMTPARIPGALPAPTGPYGLEVADLTEEFANRFGIERTLKGVVVLAVAPGSDAADKSIQPGDVILDVQGKKVVTVDDLARALKGTSGARFRIREHDGGNRFVYLRPTEEK